MSSAVGHSSTAAGIADTLVSVGGDPDALRQVWRQQSTRGGLL
jgi:hypothetical protein